MRPDNFRANIPDSIIGENFELFTDVTEGIKEQITDVFSPAEGMFPGMGSGTGNILDILDNQIGSVEDTLFGVNEDNSSAGNPTVIL